MKQSTHSSRNSSGSKKKRGRLAKVWRIAKYCIALVLVYSLWASYMIYSVGHNDAENKADCAVVFGAAAYHNKPSPVFQARLDHAILLYEKGRVKCLVLTGGKGKGAKYAEAEVGLMYCLGKGVPESKIFIETNSLTTHENIKEAKEVMQHKGLQSALLVSDPWHLRRASLMANGEGVEHECSATRTTKYQSFSSKFGFFCREFFFVQVYHVFGI